MKRVMIVGQPGSGKSTLARLIGDKTGLPVFHMDAAVHWKPGWVERPRSEKIERALDIEQRDEWVFEGNMSSTYDHRLSRADTLIVLDLPLRLRAWRVLKRTVHGYGAAARICLTTVLNISVSNSTNGFGTRGISSVKNSAP